VKTRNETSKRIETKWNERKKNFPMLLLQPGRPGDPLVMVGRPENFPRAQRCHGWNPRMIINAAKTNDGLRNVIGLQVFEANKHA